MMIRSLFVMLAMTVAAEAAPVWTANAARFESYRRLVTEPSTPRWTDASIRRVVRLLVERAAEPVTPSDLVPVESIEEVVFPPIPVNRPASFALEDFIELWSSASVVDAVGPGDVALAPDPGFLVLKDGTVIPFDLYGNASLRVWGFQFTLR